MDILSFLVGRRASTIIVTHPVSATPFLARLRPLIHLDTACTTQEWIDTSAGSGDFTTLLNVEKADTMRHFFGLFHDGYMFHQANLRTTGLPPVTVNGQSQQLSIFQAWVETIVAEFTRLVNWPTITLGQNDLATTFTNRQARDACQPTMSWSVVGGNIIGATVGSATGNNCPVAIPFTVPLGTTTNSQGYATEQIGNDPLTIWVQLSGSPVNFSFSPPVPVA